MTRSRLTSVLRRGIAVTTVATLITLGHGVPAHAELPDQTIGTAPGLPVTLSGSYLSGLLAGRSRDFANASAFFGEALEIDPGNPFLLDRAFVLKLANGDLADALTLAERLFAEQPSHFLARLMITVEAMRENRAGEARTLMENQGRNPFTALTSGLMAAWALEAKARTDDALEVIARLEGRESFAVFLAYHSALIQDHAGRLEAARDNLVIATDADPGALRVTDAYARVLARLGERDEAVAVLDAYDDINPDQPMILETRRAIEAGETPGLVATTPVMGASEVLYGLGSALASDGGQENAAALLQLALHLDPDADMAAISLAELFVRIGKHERSSRILMGVTDTSPLKRDADIQIGLNFNAMGNLDEARTHLEALVEKHPQDLDVISALGDVLRSNQMFEDAETVYSRGIETLETLDTLEPSHWTLFYSRGVCLERQQKWSHAESDFRKSLELSPDQPLVLNYLGYSLVDRGLKLDEALGMIRKAVELRPRDGYIVDSLGWAYYRLGRYEDAVRELEEAVRLRPFDPIINDHLGDAYWKVGRRLEARFQWNHARDLDPEPEELPKILDKIANGLPEEKGTPSATVEQDRNGG